MNADVEVAIVGGGPYGLATAAHLRATGRDVRVFGEPLEFWRTKTPIGMLLRSPYFGSNIGDPFLEHTLQEYERDSGVPLTRPIPVDRFIDYGLWFQERVVADLDRRTVRRVTSRPAGGFTVETETGAVTAGRVVVAAGVGPFAHVPSTFREVPDPLCIHTMDRHDLSEFAHRRVTVVGGGQSSLETAALLHELGAEVDVVVRAPIVNWLAESSWRHTTPVVKSLLYSRPDVGPALISHLVAHPRLFTRMSAQRQRIVARRAIRPAGAGWLRGRLDGVPIRVHTSVSSAAENGDRVKLALSDGSVELVDHVLLGTGYRVDLHKYEFLGRDLVDGIRQSGGYPLLSAGCESSVPGLHIVGAPAAHRHGPLMRFVAGSDFAARAVTRAVRRGRP